MPPFSTIKTFVKALQTGRTNITESLEMVRQAPCSSSDKTSILGKTAAGVFNLE